MKTKLLLSLFVVAITSSSFGQGIEYNPQSTAQHVFKEKLDSTITYGFDTSDNSWKGVYKSVFSFDENGGRTLDILSDIRKKPAEELFKLVSTYNINGTENETLHIHKSGNEWEAPWRRWKYVYDSAGKLKQKFDEYPEGDGRWGSYEKTEYEYNTNGQLKWAKNYWYDTQNSKWNLREDEVTEYVYDETGKLKTEFIGEEHKVLYVYDTSGNCVEVFYYWKRKNDINWEVDEKLEYKYDVSINYADVKNTPLVVVGSDAFYQITKINKLVEIKSTTKKVNFFYSEIEANSLRNTESNRAYIYPSIVTDNISINGSFSFANIELFNLQGQKVLNKNIEYQESINISHLNRGLYLYTIYIDGSKHCGKLIKK